MWTVLICHNVKQIFKIHIHISHNCLVAHWNKHWNCLTGLTHFLCTAKEPTQSRSGEGKINTHKYGVSIMIYRVFFLTGPPPSKCWPLSNWFQKNVKSPRLAPPNDWKTSKCLAKWIWFQHLENLGGASPSKFGGASLETFSGEGQLKKPPCKRSYSPSLDPFKEAL